MLGLNLQTHMYSTLCIYREADGKYIDFFSIEMVYESLEPNG